MERRAFPRLKARMTARLLINQERSGVGTPINMSVGGVGIQSDMSVSSGDRVVMHLNDGVRLEGVVARTFDGGFAVQLAMCEAKRARLIEALTPFFKQGEEITQLFLERRTSGRQEGMRAKAVCTTATGIIECCIVDMSLTGAAIETGEEIRIGSEIAIGQVRAKVVRRDGQIYGIEFDLPPAAPQQKPVKNVERESEQISRKFAQHGD